MYTTRLHLAALVCPLAGALALAAAAPALATDVTVAGPTLRIIDNASETNAIEVRPGSVGYDVIDDLTLLTAGPGCLQTDPHRVSCYGAITTIGVGAGGGDDIVDVSSVPTPVVLLAGDGSDLLQGGPADDVLDGGPGQDTILGNGGSDEISGGEGDDALRGEDGADKISGGVGADIVQGQAGGGDELAGNEGMDLVEGGAGNDKMTGGSGADVLVTGSGTDKVNPGSGRDQVFGTTSDDIDCNASDKVSQSSSATADGCGRLARSEPEPEIWPRPPQHLRAPDPALSGNAPIDDAGMSARAARLRLPVPTALVAGRVMHQGDARSIKTRIPSRYNQPIRVRVWVYDRNNHQITTFREDTRSKEWVDLRTGGRVAGAWSAKVKCCVR